MTYVNGHWSILICHLADASLKLLPCPPRSPAPSILVHRIGRRKVAGKIVETEAYVGPHDLACHASKGHTPRTAVMFGDAGHAYVYMIYGFHFCLNVVTEPAGYPAAVLIRAVEPLEHVDLMRQLRNNPE